MTWLPSIEPDRPGATPVSPSTRHRPTEISEQLWLANPLPSVRRAPRPPRAAALPEPPPGSKKAAPSRRRLSAFGHAAGLHALLVLRQEGIVQDFLPVDRDFPGALGQQSVKHRIERRDIELSAAPIVDLDHILHSARSDRRPGHVRRRIGDRRAAGGYSRLHDIGRRTHAEIIRRAAVWAGRPSRSP